MGQAIVMLEIYLAMAEESAEVRASEGDTEGAEEARRKAESYRAAIERLKE